MKNIPTTVLAIVAIVVGAVFWVMSHGSMSTPQPPAPPPPEDGSIVLSAPKPESFKDVEMVTYKNEFFEITFPKTWKENEIIVSGERTGSFHYSITPKIITPPGTITSNPLFGIEVEKTNREFFEPDQVGGERWVVLNGQKGIFVPGPSGADSYYFLKNQDLYTIHVVSVLKYYNISEEEVLWVLSTFKITK